LRTALDIDLIEHIEIADAQRARSSAVTGVTCQDFDRRGESGMRWWQEVSR